MRIGVWNLKQGPNPAGVRGQEMLALMRDCDADIWLLTEVHTAWSLPGYSSAMSAPRSFGPLLKRWSGILARETYHLLQVPLSGSHPADEGLCLARLQSPVDCHPEMLVACSVQPWSNTLLGWPSLHGHCELDSYQRRFRFVADAHTQRIQTARQSEDVVLWGGDFNQSLSGRPMGSNAGRAVLATCLADLDVSALTADASHLVSGACSIDHVAATSGWPASSAVTVILRSDDRRQTSDHALYLVDITSN